MAKAMEPLTTRVIVIMPRATIALFLNPNGHSRDKVESDDSVLMEFNICAP
jgi:hypothetical protein